MTWFHDIIKTDSLHFKNGHWVAPELEGKKPTSFELEWKEYIDTQQLKTWDMTAAERLSNFYIETKTTPNEAKGRIVLDAGCGNGQLTNAIANAGMRAVGIDLHQYLPPSGENVEFVRADFSHPPFKKESFDTIIANGSIHHTKNTVGSFRVLAELTKPGGKLYVWVYKKQYGRKQLLLKVLDISRFFISRFPSSLKKVTVNLLTNIFYNISRIRKGENSTRTRDEIRINVYDAFSPRYRSYHSESEVREWFVAAGFEQTEVTFKPNLYGFGMLGVKKV